VFLILKGIRYQFHGFITRDFKFGKQVALLTRSTRVCEVGKSFPAGGKIKMQKGKNSVNNV
jgi:hypothetical protein